MEHLVAVAIVVAIATFVTGLLLPLAGRSGRDAARREREETLVAEATVWN